MEGGWWFEEEDDALAGINITPLVDVALVLLIIFMITAPMMMQGANVELPRTEAINRLPTGQVIVTIAEGGEVFLNENTEPIAIDDLEERLVPFAGISDAIYIRGDANARHGDVVRVMDAAKKAGLNTINIVTRPQTAARR